MLEDERRQLGARHEPAPLDRLEEVVEIAHGERRQKALASAVSGPEHSRMRAQAQIARSTMSPAPPSSPKPSAIVRTVLPSALRPAATAPVPAEETQPAAPRRRRGALRRRRS